MKIELNSAGGLMVSDIPDNKLVAYGMLKVAEKVIDEIFKSKEMIIQPAAAIPLKIKGD